tara:strand:- start:1199 stop:1660 length:462 start_codon:yes stop_codon:yes gene_type:complete
MPVYVKEEYKNLQVNTLKLKKWLITILDQLNCSNMELSVLLVNDYKMRKLNAEYRKIDATTDVLSFPQTSLGKLDSILLGDVVVSTDTASKQANDHAISLEEEILLLIIHGILHLLGFDHDKSLSEAKKMKQKTRHLFKVIFPETELCDSIQF